MPTPEEIAALANRLVEKTLARLAASEAQRSIEVQRGIQYRYTKGKILVGRLHYSAHPERDPETNPHWKVQERRTYTSQASWDREQEIIDEAGGGELVFADTLVTYWNKIVITDPAWRPDPNWRIQAGFDHGKTNPTALERCYIDYEGTMYLCGEYYMPGKEIWEHVPEMKRMADVRKVTCCQADPTIFLDLMQQSQPCGPGHAQERAKSINELYVEEGIELFSPFRGDRSDISFAARLMLHWANLDQREPSLRIVCRNFSERPQPGLHNWDCPNLLWELLRTRRMKLTAQQLLSRNTSEAIVDKDNHAADALKYIVMSNPEPSRKTPHQLAVEAVKPLVEAGDYTSAMMRYQQRMAEEHRTFQPIRLGRYRRH